MAEATGREPQLEATKIQKGHRAVDSCFLVCAAVGIAVVGDGIGVEDGIGIEGGIIDCCWGAASRQASSSR